MIRPGYPLLECASILHNEVLDLQELQIYSVEELLFLSEQRFTRDPLVNALGWDESRLVDLIADLYSSTSEQINERLTHSISQALLEQMQLIPFSNDEEVLQAQNPREVSTFKPAHLKKTKVNHIPYFPSIRHQGTRGTCVSFASVAVREYALGRNVPLSEQFLYARCKQEDGMETRPGTYASTAFNVLLKDGVCPAQVWPYNPSHIPSNEGHLPIPKSALRRAAGYRLRYEPDSVHLDPDIIRFILLGDGIIPGRPVAVAFLIYRSSWQNPNVAVTGNIRMPLPGEVPVGGHEMAIVGWRDDETKPGGGEFLARNSWGQQWAAQSEHGAGHATISYKYVLNHCIKGQNFTVNKAEFRKKRSSVMVTWDQEKTDFAPLIDIRNNGVILGRSPEVHEHFGLTRLLYLGELKDPFGEADRYGSSPVMLDCTFPRISVITGQRGSGKSYTLGVIIEELHRHSPKDGKIVLDPMGVFWGMKFPNTVPSEVDNLKRLRLRPEGLNNVKVFVPKMVFEEFRSDIMDAPFTVAVADMNGAAWSTIFGFGNDLTDMKRLLVQKAIELIRSGYVMVDEVEVTSNNTYLIEHIIACVENSKELCDKQSGFSLSTRRAVVARFQSASKWGVFDLCGTSLRDLSVPGQLSILDISHPDLDPAIGDLIVHLMAQGIFRERKLAWDVEKRVTAGLSVSEEEQKDRIPPTWLIVDEAHLLVSNNGNSLARSTLRRYAKEGRASKCGLILADQEPNGIDSGVFSQVDLLITHTLSQSRDIETIKREMRSNWHPDMRNDAFLRSMKCGDVLIGDQKTPDRVMKVRIRPRLSWHGGATIFSDN